MRLAGSAFAAATVLFGSASMVLLDRASGQGALVIERDAIDRSLTGMPGDVVRGREIALGRERGNCLVCHVIPGPDERSHGDVGPPLKGIATRLSEGQIRMKVVDGRRLNPASMMPSYHRVDGLKRVGAAFAGKPVLTADEIEDVVAFLMTLRND